MVENKMQFYLHDRWYYLTNETDDKFVYSSNPQDKENRNILEIDKNTYKLSIVYLSKKKALGKLEMSQLENSSVRLHYTQYETKEVIVNDELYANLLFELFAVIDKRSIIEKAEIKFAKKKKLNNICYREPKIPINKRLNINELDLDIAEVDFFQEIANYPNVIMAKIKRIASEKTMVKETHPAEDPKDNKTKIVNLEVPQKLHVYDRIYHLVEVDDKIIHYENDNCEISNLDIKIDDSNTQILEIILRVTEKENELPRHIIKIFPNKQNGITARYIMPQKAKISLNDITLEKAKVCSEVVFDSSRENIKSGIEIDSRKRHYKLVSHPVRIGYYLDALGNSYKVYNNDYIEFQLMIPYIYNIYNYIEKNLLKEKELIKK